jgi:hypothetical protein
MALPGARSIKVDGVEYQWLYKKDRRATYDEDHWGNVVSSHDGKVTIMAAAGGPVVQCRIHGGETITPKWIAERIRAAVAWKQIGPKAKRK